MTPTYVIPRDSSAWDSYRLTGIGASEAAAACGMGKYQTARELYHRKRNEMPPLEDHEAMELGRVLEPLILNRYERATGTRLQDREMGLFVSSQYPWLMATPDAQASPTKGVEAKSVIYFRKDEFGPEGSDEVPEDMLFQCQHQMAVMGWDDVDLPVLFDPRGKVSIYTVRRNEDFIKWMLIQEAEFWSRVVQGDPPEHDWTHPGTPELVKYLNRDVVEGKTVELPEELAALWREQATLRDTIKEAEARREVCRAKVIEYMGGASVAIVPGQIKVIRRKVIPATSYQVNKDAYVDLREVKPPKEGK